MGTPKSLLGPEREVYEVSSLLRAEELMSGLLEGRSCAKLSDVSPGSGIDVGAGIGRGIGPIFLPAAWTSVEKRQLVIFSLENSKRSFQLFRFELK